MEKAMIGVSYDTLYDAREPASVVQCHTVISRNCFFFKGGGKKNHMTPYDNMTQIAKLHSEAIDVNSRPEAADVP
jgi:hypothetical protein